MIDERIYSKIETFPKNKSLYSLFRNVAGAGIVSIKGEILMRYSWKINNSVVGLCPIISYFF